MDYRFELIEGKARLKGTCYFEFCTDSNRKETCWNETAFYLEDEVFNFLYSVFVKANEDFDYYDYCKFEQPKLERLKEQLLDFEGTIGSFQEVEDYKDFFARLVKYPALEEENKATWDERSAELRQIAMQLRSIVEDCLKNKDALWVLGI
jgi:hypothetical protein